MGRLAQVKSDWKSRGLDWSRWIRTPNDERAALDGCVPDESLGEHVCAFLETYCTLSKDRWAGELMRLLDWQRNDFIIPLYSWVRADGRRRFRRASIWVPKKNGKSCLCSGLALYGLCADESSGAEVYFAAADGDQARIMFNHASEMVRASNTFQSIGLRVLKSRNMIQYGTNAFIKTIASDADSSHGLDASMVIIDELHAHRNRDFYDALRYAGRTRKNHLLLTISTAGDDIESIGAEEYEYALGVRDGTIEDTSLFPLIYGADPESDWKSEEVWKRANPSLGELFDIDEMRREASEAMQSPRKVAAFRRLMLNTWSESSNPWIDPSLWNACGGEIDVSSLEGSACYAGLDLSSTTDTTALVLCFPNDDGSVVLLPYVWVPELGPWRDDGRYAPMYRDWISRGFVRTIPGARILADDIVETVVELSRKYELRSVAYDPWGMSRSILALRDVHGINMVETRQGWKTMSEPCKRFEAMVAEKRIRHGDNPVLRWMVSNAVVKSDESDNVRLDKKRSKSRIDAAVAAVMALGAACFNEISDYADCGVD